MDFMESEAEESDDEYQGKNSGDEEEEEEGKCGGECVIRYCRTHNVSVCLYIAYIACGSDSLYIKTLYFFLTLLALSAAAAVANINIRYDAKIPQFAIFGTRGICVFYSIYGQCFSQDLETGSCKIFGRPNF